MGVLASVLRWCWSAKSATQTLFVRLYERVSSASLQAGVSLLLFGNLGTDQITQFRIVFAGHNAVRYTCVCVPTKLPHIQGSLHV